MNDKCLLEILNLCDNVTGTINVKGTVHEKINYLVKTLTTMTISSTEIPEIKIKDMVSGIGILKNLHKLSVEDSSVSDIEVRVLLEEEKSSIKEFNCYTGTGINIDTLFSEYLKKK